MTWRVERTGNFDKWWKKEGVDDRNFQFYERALQEFQPIAVPNHQQVRLFQNASFECWTARLPDKVNNRGKSGGYRAVLVLDLEEKVILIQGIFKRDHLSYHGSGGKRDEAFEELVKALASEFVEGR